MRWCHSLGTRLPATTRVGKMTRGIAAVCPARWSQSEQARDALFQDYNLIFHSGRAGFPCQQLKRLFDWLVRKAEGSVVHGDHPARFQIEEGLHGVGGAGVDVAKLWRIVGADRQQRDVGMEAASDFAKAVEVGRVSGVIDRMLAGA